MRQEDALTRLVESIRFLAVAGGVPHDLAHLPLGAETRIEDLGVDSVGKLVLLNEVESRIDYPIPDGALAGVTTLGEMARLLSHLARSREAP